MTTPIDFAEFRQRVEKLPPSEGLAEGGGPPHDGSMEARVSRLEVEFEHVRRDLDEIKADQKAILGVLGTLTQNLPSKSDLRTNLQWIVGTSVAVVGLFVGVLAYLQDNKQASKPEAAPAQTSPIIIQMPPYPASPVAPQPQSAPQPPR